MRDEKNPAVLVKLETPAADDVTVVWTLCGVGVSIVGVGALTSVQAKPEAVGAIRIAAGKYPTTLNAA